MAADLLEDSSHFSWAIRRACASQTSREHWRLHNPLVLFNPAPVT